MVLDNDFMLKIIRIILTSRLLASRTVKEILFLEMMLIIWISQFHAKKMIQYNNIHWSLSGMNSFKSCCSEVWTILFASYLDHWLNRPLAKKAVQSKQSLVVPASCKKISNSSIFAGPRHAVALFFHGVASFSKRRSRTTTNSCKGKEDCHERQFPFATDLDHIVKPAACIKDSGQQLFLQLTQIIWMSQPLAKKGVQNNIFCKWLGSSTWASLLQWGESKTTFSANVRILHTRSLKLTKGGVQIFKMEI